MTACKGSNGHMRKNHTNTGSPDCNFMLLQTTECELWLPAKGLNSHIYAKITPIQLALIVTLCYSRQQNVTTCMGGSTVAYAKITPIQGALILTLCYSRQQNVTACKGAQQSHICKNHTNTASPDCNFMLLQTTECDYLYGWLNGCVCKNHTNTGSPDCNFMLLQTTECDCKGAQQSHICKIHTNTASLDCNFMLPRTTECDYLYGGSTVAYAKITPIQGVLIVTLCYSRQQNVTALKGTHKIHTNTGSPDCNFMLPRTTECDCL